MTDTLLEECPVSELATDPKTAAKRAAAAAAVAMVEDGMLLGLGTGSTAEIFVDLLARRMREEGIGVVGVPTSIATAAQASTLGIPLTNLADVSALDLTVDGADEADPRLDLIKGGGGALLREKIVAAASERMVVIVDEAKCVDTLGAFPLPVEIVRFGAEATLRHIERALGAADVDATRMTRRRRADGIFITDEGNELVDLHLGRIGDPAALEAALSLLPGVIENGLFVGMASTLVVGASDGTARVVDRQA